MKLYKSSVSKVFIYSILSAIGLGVLSFLMVDFSLISDKNASIIFVSILAILFLINYYFLFSIYYVVENNMLYVKRFNHIIKEYEISKISISKENITAENKLSSALEYFGILLSIYTIILGLYKIRFTYNDSNQKLNLSTLGKIDAKALLNDLNKI